MSAEIRKAATQAWRAGVRGDWATAAAALNAVAGMDGAAQVVVAAFADTVCAGMRRNGFTEKPEAIAWVDVSGLGPTIRHADQVASCDAWAGRVLMARWRLDEDQWRALWAAIPEGRDSEYIGAALEMCVHTSTAYGLDAVVGR